MRYLITMHMPSAQGNLVHQVTVEHHCKNLQELCDMMNDSTFIMCRLLYRERAYHHMEGGDTVWVDKGQMILNTNHIGKVSEFRDKDDDDESYRSAEQRGGNFEGKRPPLRAGRRML